MAQKIDRIEKTSDFKFEIQIQNSDGVAVDPSTLKWQFEHYIFRNKIHIAGFDGVSASGCSIDGNKIIVPIQNNTLGVGRIIRRSTIYYPDPQMPNGTYKDVSSQKLNVEIYDI